jgi:monothiol glutaredoxin
MHDHDGRHQERSPGARAFRAASRVDRTGRTKERREGLAAAAPSWEQGRMSDIQSTIRETVEKNRVVLFMKGTKNFPQCGFSARAVEVLKKCGVEFKDVNVLADPELRQGIKEFSNWPTIPQVYVDGQFVGGSDILMEMFQNGELQKLVTPKS